MVNTFKYFLQKQKYSDIIGITHGFACINICRVLRKLFEQEAARPRVQIFSEGPGKCYCNETTMALFLHNLRFQKQIMMKTPQNSI